MRLWRTAFVALFLGVVGVLGGSPTITTAGGNTFTYDAPTIARVGVHEFEAAATSPAQLSGSRQESASRSVDGRRTSTTSSRSFIATEAESVAVNGETAATKLGREMHKSWDYGPGFEMEFTLDAGGRVDAINFETREVIELKPNNPRAIRLGERQVGDYVAKLNQQFPGDPWTGRVVTYGP